MDNKTRDFWLKKIEELRHKVLKIKKFTKKKNWKEFRANINKEENYERQ